MAEADLKTGRGVLLRGGLWALGRLLIMPRVLKFAASTGGAAFAKWLVLGPSPRPFINASYAALVYTYYGLRHVDIPL